MTALARALFDFKGDALKKDLSFSRGDIIVIEQKVSWCGTRPSHIQDITSSDWWEGKIGDSIGRFPRVLVELVDVAAAGDAACVDCEGSGVRLRSSGPPSNNDTPTSALLARDLDGPSPLDQVMHTCLSR